MPIFSFGTTGAGEAEAALLAAKEKARLLKEEFKGADAEARKLKGSAVTAMKSTAHGSRAAPRRSKRSSWPSRRG